MNEYPYWWDTAPTRRVGREKIEGKSQQFEPRGQRIDVAIIGAGYTGLSAARYLARAGASVVVIERERIGWGASSRNAGQVLTGLQLDPATMVARFGEARARQLFHVSLESIARLESLIVSERIACDYERTGHVQAAAKPSQFRAFEAEQTILGRVFHHPVQLVPRSAQRSEVGSDRYHGLLVDERSGALNPAKYVDGLASAAEGAGASIVTATPVEAFERRASRWAITVSSGGIDAGHVLVATDAYTNGAAGALQRRLVPIGSYIIATEPLDDATAAGVLPRRRTAFDANRCLHYFRLTPDQRLLFGGRAEFTPPTPASTRRAADTLRREMVQLFPGLAAVRVDFAWGGKVAFTRDRLPHAGRLEGAYYAGGYGGHGIAMATYLGELIARRIGGEKVDHPLMDDRLAAIPFYHGRPWLLPLLGLYYRVLDRVD